MSSRDLYRILELSPNCQPHDVKRNYRNLALKWHPDKHINKKEATDRFHQINEAYSILVDTNQRKVYDLFGYEEVQKLRDNVDASNENSNLFLKKGFQGTDKSAFEVLWDILKEKDDNLFTQAYKEEEVPNDFMSNLEDLANDFNLDKDPEDVFFNNYTPTFADPNFINTISMLNKNLNGFPQKTKSGHINSANQPNTHKAAQNQWSHGLNENYKTQKHRSFIFNNNYKDINSKSNSINSPIIIIDDEEGQSSPYQASGDFSFADQLNQFQGFLNEFHRNLEDNLYNRVTLNSQSKKISKKGKVCSNFINKKEQPKEYNTTSVPIYS